MLQTPFLLFNRPKKPVVHDAGKTQSISCVCRYPKGYLLTPSGVISTSNFLEKEYILSYEGHQEGTFR